MSLEIEVRVEIAAPPDRIWSVLADIDRWPEWDPAVTALKRLDAAPFGPGGRARVTQPRLPKNVWQVTRWEPSSVFVWETKSPGAHTIAEHWIIPDPSDPKISVVILKIKQTGAMAAVLRPWIEKLTRHYVEMESQGLKRRCEAADVK
jgi:uncharacterized protein YndB with AHSA1/START domain